MNLMYLTVMELKFVSLDSLLTMFNYVVILVDFCLLINTFFNTYEHSKD